jgi:hypothetical protein
MSKLIGDTLPAELLAALDGEELERKIGPAHLLLTGDADGTPRPCMLSAGEVLAVDERRLRFALWADSRTTANLADGGRAVFCYAAPGTVLYVRGAARPLDAPNADRLRCFELAVDSVEADGHRGFPVASGISFEVESGEPGEMLETWRRQLALLRGTRSRRT